eukprot:scaffold309911_cov28-Tisochrysis_lutea.AAC.7
MIKAIFIPQVQYPIHYTDLSPSQRQQNPILLRHLRERRDREPQRAHVCAHQQQPLRPHGAAETN